jgi:outer membrane immunogenic protein
MRRQFIAALAGVAVSAWLSTAASTADLSRPAPAPVYTKAPVVEPWNWTGFYVGGNVGYGWGKSDEHISALQSSQGFSGGFWSLDATDSNKVNGLVGGAQAGYNWQIRNLLLGLEADIQGSGQTHTSTLSAALIDPGIGTGNNPVSITDTSKLDWFGTVRGRLGVLASDRWLVYATGGLAYGQVHESGNVQPANPDPIDNNAPLPWNHATTKVGWTVGAGVENAISRNWSWKAEYLYMDLGNVTSNVSGGVGNIYADNGPLTAAAFGTITTKLTDNILRVGVNYRFW